MIIYSVSAFGKTVGQYADLQKALDVCNKLTCSRFDKYVFPTIYNGPCGRGVFQ